MATGKWIGGFLGFIMGGGPLGALAGFALGALFDAGLNSVNTADNTSSSGNAHDGYSQDRQHTYRQRRTYEGERNSFLFSLLVLASYIIRADGRIMHSEMELVRQFLRRNFGETAVKQGEQILLRLFEEAKKMGSYEYGDTIRKCCRQIAANMSYGQRLQLLDFLLMIARADSHVDASEIDALREVAQHLNLSAADLDSMLNLGQKDLESAYRVLGVASTATDSQVKDAYRRMALRHHPDRVATLGEDIKKAAEKKFQEINDAKERIYRARGL
ncbi:molecular chaperone DjlA [Prevotella sp. oral taxon 376]|uniref:TerB family tellurite resistance protein n=1 Tax=Prevotella sp. oral taxon 376 TaxID=712466 RepID=UPI000D1F7CF9|nr:TerB family tellurite resistance protein [Prevotella sp. oral taxon 376]PTL34305.1 molecular chaperone DjlA [Prevotella sp. oral taxon 376]